MTRSLGAGKSSSNPCSGKNEVVLQQESLKCPIQSWRQSATQSEELPDYRASIMTPVQRTIQNNRKVVLCYVLA